MADGDGLDGWVRAALWAAKSRGRVSFICRADRGAELIHLFAAAGAGEAVVFPLWPRANVPAGRVIVTVRKRVAGPGAILPGLVLHNADGSFTAAASAIMKARHCQSSTRPVLDGCASYPNRQKGTVYGYHAKLIFGKRKPVVPVVRLGGVISSSASISAWLVA